MSHNSLLFIGILIIQIFSTSHAEITFDGSFGPAIKLRGPNYTIDATQGSLVGSNLFYFIVFIVLILIIEKVQLLLALKV